MGEPTIVVVCYSKCLYCGRRTPHEVCHEHSEALHPGWWDALEAAFVPDQDDPELGAIDAIWGTGYDKEPEACEDGTCPVWEPGEWDRIQAERSMTPEQRQERLERIRQGIEERRRQRPAEGGQGDG